MSTAAQPASTPGAASFGKRAARGTLWTLLRYAVEYVVRLGGNLILTRLLFPEAFGLMALVNAFLAGLKMFSDAGISPSVVQSAHGDRPEFLRTAWTMQVLRGVLLFGIAAALAGVMADLYQQAELAVLIPVVGLSVLISGFGSISLARLRRHILLGRLAAIDITAKLVSAAVTISWALISPSVWALVAGGLTSALVKMLLSHTVLGERYWRFGWDPNSVRKLVQFGKWVFLSTLLAFLAGQADRLLFGRLLPVATLGVYSIAAMLAAVPTQLAWNIGHQVLFPTFSRIADTNRSLALAHRRVQRLLCVLGTFPVACLAAAGPALIGTLYDPRYADAGWMLQPLVLATWFQILQTANAAALLASGDARRLAMGNGLKFAAMIVLVPTGFVYYDALGGIWGLALAEVFRYATLARGARRHRLPGSGRDLAYSMLTLAATAAGFAGSALAPADFHPALRVLCAVGGVSAVWLPVAGVVLREDIANGTAALRSRGGSTSASDPPPTGQSNPPA